MSAAATTARPQVKPPKIMACAHCQYRKIRCDRLQPCSNCIKAKITCQPTTPTPAHQRRRRNQELLDRLARCEELLKQYAEGNGPAQQESIPATTKGSLSTARAEAGPKTTTHKPTGKIVQEDGSVRFVDNYIRLSFHGELEALRDVIDDDDDDQDSESDSLSPDNSEGIFLGVEDAKFDLQAFRPDVAHVFRLWQLFIDRVNPLTKVVHIPSLQPYVMDAATDINRVPLAYQALLFSIYTMAIVSTTAAECIEFFGMPREDALNRFTKGTKLALTRVNFFNTCNMTVLQALVFYMLSLEGRTENHSTWIMSGTVLRLAQKMGYHRDGEELNLSPFETEMRRRIWWQVLHQDSRYAISMGLSQSWVPLNGDTKLPQNLNDADLFPNSMEPLTPRDGPTEMAFVLLIYHLRAFVIKNHGQLEAGLMAVRNGGSSIPANTGPLKTYRALIDEIDTELADFEQKYVNPSAGGVQLAASTLRPLLIDKMRAAAVPMTEQPEWGTEIFDHTDSIFKSFVEKQFKKSEVFVGVADTGFMWYIRSGLKLDIISLFTARLYRRPGGKLTEKAWAAFQLIHDFHPDLFDVSQKKVSRQAQFTLRAWAARERVLTHSRQPVVVPEFVRRLRQISASSQTGLESLASGSQPFLLQQRYPSQQMPLDQDHMNEYLGRDLGGVDFNPDMWGNLSMGNDGGTQEQRLRYDEIMALSGIDSI
ncbi:fungal-specific transcription factor domain-containing protein [Xylaria intraflava]|nr:fungal-specific transcription factor domain-containing protein [Xylaria intraflava]